ncbi:Ribosomal protein L11 methyltransferase (PrmA) [Poseidonocella pacifica]|uniref:Ribosomal protein L11 methyltransferase (PrmA) n=1 Tax=Poseidonocella pacifica TaxID=871651 RepID=A0A1I0VWC4_9RHOB|nr:50S ribosomal protein L11 methyltransferase [Poseidonocella pacifica]SFA80604.1 Ribosomal protein L11 methyltransferase (PrmA) [Poseidonocella pacifica]
MTHPLHAASADAAGETTKQQADELVLEAQLQPLADGGVETSRLLSEALRLDPSNHDAQILLERLHQMTVPRWHFPMLADTGRNQAYAKAIAEKVKPGDVVLDIGCGAGLTAMLAARAGAKHVYTCEQQPLIAAAAKEVIARNGLSDRITVIPKWSHDIKIGVDMPEQADVVLSEIVDTVLLGEGALATLTLAMKSLAKPGARCIPESGMLFAQPIESDSLYEVWRPQAAEGFDLSGFHHFATVAQMTPGEFDVCNPRPLGIRAKLFDFDFTNPSMKDASISGNLVCSEAGMVHAVLVTFEMRLTARITVGNGITAKGHWGRTAFLLKHPEAVAARDMISITAQHDTAALSLTVDGIVAPEATSQSDGASTTATGKHEMAASPARVLKLATS